MTTAMGIQVMVLTILLIAAITIIVVQGRELLKELKRNIKGE